MWVLGEIEIAELRRDPDPMCAGVFMLGVVGVSSCISIGTGTGTGSGSSVAAAIAIAIGRWKGEEQVDVADGKVG